MIPRPPLVSIITVTYNSAHVLEGTMRSVLMQDYPHIEYLVIDGASSDHTKTIVKHIQNTNDRLLNAKMLRCISEPDHGLYDAMNKGLRMANGDFVWFLNAGDRLFEKDTVGKMMKYYTPGTDVLFGEVMLVSDTRRPLGTRSELTTQKLPELLTWKSMKLGMAVCHQAFVPRKTIAPAYIGDNLAADIDWVIECLKRSRKTVNTHLILAEYLIGGLSKQRHLQSLRDRFNILKKHFGQWPNLWNHVLIIWRAIWNFNGKY